MSDDDLAAEAGDTIVVRTDDGLIHATVEEAHERPQDGARMGGTLEPNGDDPRVHYVDYWRGGCGDDRADDSPEICTDGGHEMHAVETRMNCHDCGVDLDEYAVVEREDGSEKYVCEECAPEDGDNPDRAEGPEDVGDTVPFGADVETVRPVDLEPGDHVVCQEGSGPNPVRAEVVDVSGGRATLRPGDGSRVSVAGGYIQRFAGGDREGHA